MHPSKSWQWDGGSVCTIPRPTLKQLSKIKTSSVLLFTPALFLLWHVRISSVYKACADSNLLYVRKPVGLYSCVQILTPSALESLFYISEWIRVSYEPTARKNRLLWTCMCACAYVYVCKYVLMGPLIKTLGVSAICQHWSIGWETDSSLCVRVCVCTCKFECVPWVFLASSAALCFMCMLFYMSLRHVTAVQVGLTHILCTHTCTCTHSRHCRNAVNDLFLHADQTQTSQSVKGEWSVEQMCWTHKHTHAHAHKKTCTSWFYSPLNRVSGS